MRTTDSIESYSFGSARAAFRSLDSAASVNGRRQRTKNWLIRHTCDTMPMP